MRLVTDEGRRLFQRNSWFGLRQQKLRGEGHEYEALAEYQPGMDRRAIDWNASARHVKLLAKEYRVERDNRVVLAIDAIDWIPRHRSNNTQKQSSLPDEVAASNMLFGDLHVESLSEAEYILGTDKYNSVRNFWNWGNYYDYMRGF